MASIAHADRPAPTETRLNEELFRRLIEEGFNKGNLDAVDDILTPDFVEHQFSPAPLPLGPEGTKLLITDLRRLMPDVRLTVEDIVVEGDKVWARMACRGTNLGSFMGRPPTGKRVETEVIDICRFANGKMVEHWGVPDRFHLAMELGVIPRPGNGPGEPA